MRSHFFMKIITRTTFDCSPKELFDFYLRPGNFRRMIAPWNRVVVLSREGEEEGSETAFRVRILGLWHRWTLKRHTFSPGSSFVDVQVRGPFAFWKHTHRFLPTQEGGSIMEDEVEFRLLGGIGERWARKKIEQVLKYRHETLRADRAIILGHQSPPLRILLSGSTGFIGKQLALFLRIAGHEVISLVRTRKREAESSLFWDPAKGEVPKEELEGFDAVIHLAGKNIASGRWTEKLKKELFLSRCRDTWLLSQAFLRVKNPPSCFISASAVGIYGSRGDEPLTEKSTLGEGFLAELSRKWEEASGALEGRGIRTVYTRFGLVISPGGGLLKRLIPSIKWGFGAILGSGKQYLSWVALDDLLYAIYHLLMEKSVRGPVNVTSPVPLRMESFMKTLGAHMGRPVWLKVGGGLLSQLGGEMAREMVLSGQYACPSKLQETGFVFHYPTLDLALDHYAT